MSDPAAFFLEWKQQLLGSLQACFQGGGDPRTPTPSERQHRLHVQRLLSLRSSTFVEQLARLDPARVDTSPLPAPYNELATVHITRCRLFIPLAEAFLSRQPRPAELHRRHSPDGWKIHPPLASTLIQTDQQGTPTDAELQLTAAMNTFATTLVDALSDACSASGSHSQPSGLLPPAALLLGWLLRTALTDLRYGAISAGLAHGNVVRCSSQFLSLLEAILGINAPCNLAGVRLRASLALYAMVQRLALQDPIRKLSRELETAHNQFSRRLPLTVDGQPVFCLKRTSGLMLLSLNPRFFGDYDLSLLYQQVARALLPANVHDAVHYYRQALRHCPPTHTRTIGG
ncbi:hypothetical protein H696_01140 [Fonticula alba]|uniref:Uncharacterized protein n=1 Tax=Fonticula alba TaxID=691883 RepID=A0A058ZCQ9_FONAL|nr:hypothetical protein H696_01140 [Fonticula alba]KCV71718.1 hypothetical protein H696_01140 [Fonticula alba]|eukprot:XP_009493296.1 hypothetical protein H696_01140 [Fonticula alba]